MNSKGHSRSTKEGFQHPMLLYGTGITTIAAAGTSLVNAFALSIIMIALCCTMAIIYIFERGEYMQPMLSVLYFVPAAFIVCGSGMVLNTLSASTSARLGMYLPIMAADALVLARLEPDSPFLLPSFALPTAIRLWWLYAAMALPIGLLREFLGQGTVLGQHIFSNPVLSGMNLPFAGFLLLGFGLAIYNTITKNGSI